MQAPVEQPRNKSIVTTGAPCIHVLDDDLAIQSLLRSLGEMAGYEVHCYGTAGAFAKRTSEDRPGCLVLDLMRPDGTGIDVLQRLVASGNELPVVFMSGMASVAEAVRALKLGSIDFVEKPFELSRMRDALERAIQLDRERRQTAGEQERRLQRFARLSPRETEVLERIVRGAANKEVALQLGLSPKTVEVHRANVTRKTGADSLADLVRMHIAVNSAKRQPQPTGGQ